MVSQYGRESSLKKIKDDGIWSKRHTNITNEGKRIHYRFNQVKRRGEPCPASIYVLYYSENECVISPQSRFEESVLARKDLFVREHFLQNDSVVICTMYETEDDHLHKEPRSIGINPLDTENAYMRPNIFIE